MFLLKLSGMNTNIMKTQLIKKWYIYDLKALWFFYFETLWPNYNLDLRSYGQLFSLFFLYKVTLDVSSLMYNGSFSLFFSISFSLFFSISFSLFFSISFSLFSSISFSLFIPLFFSFLMRIYGRFRSFK